MISRVNTSEQDPQLRTQLEALQPTVFEITTGRLFQMGLPDALINKVTTITYEGGKDETGNPHTTKIVLNYDGSINNPDYRGPLVSNYSETQTGLSPGPKLDWINSICISPGHLGETNPDYTEAVLELATQVAKTATKITLSFEV